jgi:hypothetical protein
MFSKSLTKHFKGFDSGFTELHVKLDADTLVDFSIHGSQRETRSQKSTCKSNTCSQRGVLWQTDAIGLSLHISCMAFSWAADVL